jgi:hypothetical protein
MLHEFFHQRRLAGARGSGNNKQGARNGSIRSSDSSIVGSNVHGSDGVNVMSASLQ